MDGLRERSSDESGFTLPEMIISSLILFIVIIIIGGIMTSSQKTTVLVTTTTTATSNGQAAINSIETGVRNSENSLGGSVPLKLTNPTGYDQMLTGLVIGKSTAGTAACQAWYYQASTSKLYTKTSSAQITAPTAAQVSKWVLLASGVSPVSGTSIFTFVTPTVTVSYKVDAGKDPAVPFTSTFASRTGSTGTITCF